MNVLMLWLECDQAFGDHAMQVGPFPREEDRAQFLAEFWPALEALNKKLGLKDPAEARSEEEEWIGAGFEHVTQHRSPTISHERWTAQDWVSSIEVAWRKRYSKPALDIESQGAQMLRERSVAEIAHSERFID